jgi:hypothetical protein
VASGRHGHWAAGSPHHPAAATTTSPQPLSRRRGHPPGRDDGGGGGDGRGHVRGGGEEAEAGASLSRFRRARIDGLGMAPLRDMGSHRGWRAEGPGSLARVGPREPCTGTRPGHSPISPLLSGAELYHVFRACRADAPPPLSKPQGCL